MKTQAIHSRTVKNAEGLGPVMRSLRPTILMLALISGVANLLLLVPTIYMLQVYDRVLVSRNELTLLVVSLITLFLFGCLGLSQAVRSRMLVRMGLQLDALLGGRVFAAGFERSLQTPGKVRSTALQDLTKLRQFLTGSGILAFFDAPWSPIFIGVLFLLHPLLGLCALLFAALQLAMSWWGRQHTGAAAALATDVRHGEQAFLQGKLQHADVVESMGMLGAIEGRWLQRHGQTRSRIIQSNDRDLLLAGWSKWLRYSQQSLALGMGALLVIKGELSAGAMIASNVLMTRALTPLDQLNGLWQQFRGARQAFARLNELLLAHNRPVESIAPVKPNGVICLRSVSAQVVGRTEPVLQAIDLTVGPGRVTVVMGPSGSGKSTLVRVLLGLWTDIEGEVTLDGSPLSLWPRERLGPYVGYLPQDMDFFEGTIAENIARMGEVDADAVVRAARSAGLHDMILRLPRGYETKVGLSGHRLSGGQIQRLGLARALYGSPPVVVLDEPNAHLDDSGEAALAQVVQHMKDQGQTVVLVTHRPSVVSLADELVIMNNGRIAMQGPRDEIWSKWRGDLVQAQIAGSPESGESN